MNADEDGERVSGEATIGSYALKHASEVWRRPGVCHWLRAAIGAAPRPRLRIWLAPLGEPRRGAEVSATEIAKIAVSRRPKRGPELKRPELSRPWRVRLLDAGGADLTGSLGFRRESEARDCADRLRLWLGPNAASEEGL